FDDLLLGGVAQRPVPDPAAEGVEAHGGDLVRAPDNSFEIFSKIISKAIMQELSSIRPVVDDDSFAPGDISLLPIR
ncbi:TPA: hypothetical protein ACKRPD_005813, partial [Pseudomonas aeruginosa]